MIDWNKQLSLIIGLATDLHKDQYDRQGFPYILHPLRVMNQVRIKTNDVELMCIAVGHDTAEDCFGDIDEGLEWLERAGVDESVIDGICYLSKYEGEDYREYIKKIPAKLKIIKAIDIRDNISPNRNGSEKPIEISKKFHDYIWALNYLENRS